MMDTLITFINDTGSSWAFALGHAAWQAALVGIVLLLIVRLGHRWPAPLRYGLLLLALLKFAMPPILPSPTGIISQFATPLTATVTAAAPVESVEPFPFPADYSNESDAPSTEALATTVPITVDPPAKTATVTDTVGPQLTWQALALLIYAMGVIGYALWAIRQLLGLRGIVLRSTRVTTGDLYNEHLRLCRTLGLRTPPRLLFTNETIGPMAFGVFAPTIVLPQSVESSLSPRETEAMLAHEIAHHRRRDPWVIGFQIVLNSIWWFHPVLWLLNRSVRKTREDCCDDLLLSSGITKGEDYCDTLLHVASGLAVRAVHGTALGFMEGWHPLGRRIKRIMDPSLRRSARLSLAGALLLLALGLVFLPGLRMRAEETEKPTTASATSTESIPSTTSTDTTTNDDAVWETELDRLYLPLIDYPQGNLSDLLTSISATSKFDIVAASGVQGKISATLVDKTLREQLDEILLPYDFQWERIGNIVYVTGKQFHRQREALAAPRDSVRGADAVQDVTETEEIEWERKLDKVYLPLVEFSDTEIRDILTSLARTSPFEIDSSTEVNGKPTTFLRKKSLRDVLNAILIPNGWEWKRVGGTIHVSKMDAAALNHEIIDHVGIGIHEIYSCPIFLTGSSITNASRSFEWRIQRKKPLKLVHGWYTLVDGVVAEYAGGGVSGESATGTMELSLESGVDEGMITLKLGKSEGSPGDLKRVKVASRTAMPEGCSLEQNAVTQIGQLTSTLTTLWEGRCIVDGTTVKTIRYAARVADASEQVSGFEPPAEYRGRKPTNAPLLQFRLVAEPGETGDIEELPGHGRSSGREESFRVFKEVLLDEKDIELAETSHNTNGPEDRWIVNLTFTEQGKEKFKEVTQQNVGHILAIIYDGKVLSAPTIQMAITGGRAQITGNFDQAEAERIAATINERIGKRATAIGPLLQFRLVADNPSPDTEELPNPQSNEASPQIQHVYKDILLDEKDIELAEAGRIKYGEIDRWNIILTFTEEGSQKFAEVTERSIGKMLAIIFDGEVLSAPRIQQTIEGGRAQITGDFDEARAIELANAINERLGRPAKIIEGTVMGNNGAPAAGARVIAGNRDMLLSNWESSTDSNYSEVVSDEMGRFALPPHYAPQIIVAIHEIGYAISSSEDLTAKQVVQLLPWERVKGTCHIGRSPAAGVKIEARPIMDNWLDNPSVFSWIRHATTDENGHFVIDRLPSGSVRVCRIVERQGKPPIRFHGVNASIPSDALLVIGGTGRPVTGQIKVPALFKHGIAWDSADISITAIPSGFPSMKQILSMDPDEAARLMPELEKTPEGRDYVHGYNIYPGTVSKTGEFRVEDVPAGHYQFVITAMSLPDPSAADSNNPNLKSGINLPYGFAMTELTIPDMPNGRSDEPLDIGEVTLRDMAAVKNENPGRTTPANPGNAITDNH